MLPYTFPQAAAATAWVRPADWLAMPSPGAEEFIGLFAVFDTDANYLAFSFAGAYTVDWGDGTAAENVATGVTAQHIYDYATISSGTLSSLGYKQVLVRVTPQSAQNLTSINLQRKHSTITPSGAYGTPWLDLTLNLPSLTTQTIGGTTTSLSIAERINVTAIGNILNFTNMFAYCYSLASVPLFNTASGTNFTSMFAYCSSLSSVPLFNTALGTIFTSMFQNCSSLASVPLFNTAAGTNFTSMFLNCYSLSSVPLFNTAAGTNFTNIFTYCYSLASVPLFNTASGTNFTSMFAYCSSLSSVPLFNTALGTNFTSMFQNCYSLASVPLFNTALGTIFTNMFQNCSSLASGALTGTTYTISYASNKLSTAAIVAIFNALGTAAGAQTITVTGNWGAAGLTAGDLAIATGKGWTVAT